MDTMLVMPTTAAEEYRPKIREWQLYFLDKYGLKNRDKVVRKFVDFYHSKKGDEITFADDENCKIGGRVYGHAEYGDGDRIVTSRIKSIKRVICAAEGAPHDLMCVYTTTEHKYYIYSDEYSRDMCLMMGDMMFVGKLHDEPRYYQCGCELDARFI